MQTQAEGIKELVKNVAHVKHAMLDQEVATERGWVLRTNREEYVIFGESEVTLTPHKHKASFFPDYAEAIVQAKTRTDLKLSLVVAERVKRDKQ